MSAPYGVWHSQEFGRIDHVRRAAFVDKDVDRRIFADECSRRARVVEMDVRQQDLADIRDGHALAPQRQLEVVERRRRARIDQRDTRGAVKDDGRNDFRHPQEIEIDVIKSGSKGDHGWRAILYQPVQLVIPQRLSW